MARSEPKALVMLPGPETFPSQSATRNHHALCVDCLPPSSRARYFQTMMACIAIGLLLYATAVNYLYLGGGETSSVASVDRTPMSAIETAFGALGVSSFDTPAARKPTAEKSCDDFVSWFLDPGCSKSAVKHAARRHKHRVATFIAGRPGAPASASAAAIERKLEAGTANVILGLPNY